MITYAGVDLSLPDPDGRIKAHLDAYWHLAEVADYEHPGYTAAGLSHLPVPQAPERKPPRCGVLSWPTGAARWATFYHLVSGTQLASIRAAIGATPAAAELKVWNSDEPGADLAALTPQMWMLPPRPVCQLDADVRGTDDQAYLLTLVDERYWWWSAGDQAAPTTAASWSALLTALFTAVGVASPTIATVPAAYGVPDMTRWAVGYKPLPVLIDAVCRTVGLKCLRYTTGDVECVTASTALSRDTAAWQSAQYNRLVGGRYTAADVAPTLPAKVSVVFNGSTPADAVLSNATLNTLALTEYGGNQPGVASRTATIGGELANTANATARGSYANQAASDWYLWQLAPTDAAFGGVVRWDVTGMEDRVEWLHDEGKVITRVVRPPLADRNVYGDRPGNGTIPDANHTLSGKVNLSDQYLGAGVKTMDKVVVSGGDGNYGTTGTSAYPSIGNVALSVTQGIFLAPGVDSNTTINGNTSGRVIESTSISTGLMYSPGNITPGNVAIGPGFWMESFSWPIADGLGGFAGGIIADKFSKSWVVTSSKDFILYSDLGNGGSYAVVENGNTYRGYWGVAATRNATYKAGIMVDPGNQPFTSGTVTSVALVSNVTGATLTISGSPVTGAGTLTISGAIGSVTSVNANSTSPGLSFSGGPVTGAGTLTLSGNVVNQITTTSGDGLLLTASGNGTGVVDLALTINTPGTTRASLDVYSKAEVDAAIAAAIAGLSTGLAVVSVDFSGNSTTTDTFYKP